MLFLATGLIALGSFFLGVYSGKRMIHRAERRTNLLHATGPSNGWWFAGVSLVAIGLVIGIFAKYPVQRLIDHADQVRSATIVAKEKR